MDSHRSNTAITTNVCPCANTRDNSTHSSFFFGRVCYSHRFCLVFIQLICLRAYNLSLQHMLCCVCMFLWAMLENWNYDVSSNVCHVEWHGSRIFFFTFLSLFHNLNALSTCKIFSLNKNEILILLVKGLTRISSDSGCGGGGGDDSDDTQMAFI